MLAAMPPQNRRRRAVACADLLPAIGEAAGNPVGDHGKSAITRPDSRLWPNFASRMVLKTSSPISLTPPTIAAITTMLRRRHHGLVDADEDGAAGRRQLTHHNSCRAVEPDISPDSTDFGGTRSRPA